MIKEKDITSEPQETDALYREHKGSLLKSLETVIYVFCLNDIKEHYDEYDDA